MCEEKVVLIVGATSLVVALANFNLIKKTSLLEEGPACLEEQCLARYEFIRNHTCGIYYQIKKEDLYNFSSPIKNKQKTAKLKNHSMNDLIAKYWKG